MKLGIDIHGPQRMNPTDFGDPLTHIVPPPGQYFHLSCEISAGWTGSRTIYPSAFFDSLTFL